MRILKKCWWIAVMMSCFAMSVHAEGIQPKENGPPSRKDRTKAVLNESLDSAGQAWVSAMEELGDPDILFSFGIDDGGTDRSMGLNLTKDELAVTQSLATQISAFMGDAYIDTEIIDYAEVQAIQARVAADMGDAGLDFAINRAMNEASADLGIICQFTPLPDGTYRANLKIVEPRTGRQTSVGSYPVDPGTHSINRTAAAIFEVLAHKVLQISTRKSPMFSVMIIGDIGDKEFRGLTGFVADIKYVESKKKNIKIDKKTDFYKLRKIRYDGTALDLGYEISDVLTKEFDVRSKVMLSEGEIAIRVYGNIEPPAWHLLTSVKTNSKKEMFEALYRERGSLRVAVVTNGHPEYSKAIEDNVAGMMMNAGVNVVDAGQARSVIGSSGLNMADEEQLAKLRDLGGFDVLVLGNGQSKPGSLLPHTTYRAIMVGNGRLLGACSWPSQAASEDPEYGVDSKNPDVRDVSRFLSGTILDMFMRNHLLKSTSIDIRVDGVASLRQAMFIASSIESVVSGVKSATNVRLSGDVANFTIQYSGDQNSLMVALQESISLLPIDTKIEEAGPGVIKLLAKPLGTDG